MKEFNSCKMAMQNCIDRKYFAIAHLYKDEKAMDMHIHDCYEVYYSISGGRQFLIQNKLYDIAPGDLFVINQYESHYLTQIDSCIHERIVLSVYPDFIRELSSPDTNLDDCFSMRPEGFSHRIRLSSKQQQRFLYYVDKLLSANGYGQDLIERAVFTELFVMIGGACMANRDTPEENSPSPSHRQTDDILSFINRNISEPLSIADIARHFYISESYACRIFKASTGTTINKYITARRISIAKSLLAEGKGVSDVCELCGFNDYSSFFKAFTKSVGISPKKYANLSG